MNKGALGDPPIRARFSQVGHGPDSPCGLAGGVAFTPIDVHFRARFKICGFDGSIFPFFRLLGLSDGG